MAKRKFANSADPETLLAQAALRLLVKEEWATLTLAAVARSARISLPDALAIASSKAALPAILLRMFAREAARRHVTETGSGIPREHLFDVTMTWFDVQKSYSLPLRKLYGALRYDPATLLAMRNGIVRLAEELLGLAEADAGLSPAIQSAVFGVILVRAVSTWRDDDDEMGKTMAQLDGDLRRAERFLWSKPGTAGVSPASPKARKKRPRRPRSQEKA